MCCALEERGREETKEKKKKYVCVCVLLISFIFFGQYKSERIVNALKKSVQGSVKRFLRSQYYGED
jgi:hypothetical protein